MRILKIIGIVISLFVLSVGISWGFKYLGIIEYGIFEPKREEVRREVFKETRSFVESKTQDLAKYKLEYNSYIKEGDNQSAQAILSTVRIQFSDVDKEDLPLELHSFLVRARGY